MQAYRMVAWKTPPEYREVPQPEPGAGQVLVRVGAAGLCHSDLAVIHEVDGEDGFNGTLPFTIGHETAGWVEALGLGATGFEAGEAVAVYGPIGCGTCARCQTGDENICDRRREMPASGRGLGIDGGMAPYLLVDAPRQLAPLGDLDPVSAAPLTCAGITSYRMIRRSLPWLGPGSKAVVIGIGGLGHLAVQILRALTPTTVIAVDAKPAALALAMSLGAHHTVAAGPDAAGALEELTGGHGVDATFDLVGSEETLRLALDAARAGGRIMLVGYAMGYVPYGMGVTNSEVELTTVFSGSRSDLQEVIALTGDGLLEPTVTTFPFAEIPQAIQALEDGALEGRAVIVP
jgi:alcohol dehydrogenase, propanol-preferring